MDQIELDTYNSGGSVGEFLEPSYDFFRYVLDLKEYKDIDTNVN